MAITQGTWGVLPDFGITEKLFGGSLNGTPLSGVLTNPNQSVAAQGGLDYSQVNQVPANTTINSPVGPAVQPNAYMSPTKPAVTTPAIPYNQAQSSGPGDLVSALVGKGYSLVDAQNAANGPNADNLRREYLGGSTPAPTYNIRGTNIQAPTGKDALTKAGLVNTDYDQFASQFNNDPTAFLNAIESGYAGQFDALGQQQSALEEARRLAEGTIGSQYGENLSKAQGAKASTAGKLKQNQVEAEQRKQDALNSARRLYNELQSGYRQRFGGATSAGEASQAILGAEQQRQATGIGRDYGTAVAQIKSQEVDLENNFNTAIRELDTQKQTALRDIQSNFMTNLNQINTNRAQTTQAKEQAKLQLLNDMRNQALQIDQQNRQYAQQLELMKEQQRMSLQSSLAGMQQSQTGFAQAGQQAISRIPTQVSTQLGQNNRSISQNVLQSQPQIQSAVGAIAPRSFGGQAYDQWGNPLSLGL